MSGVHALQSLIFAGACVMGFAALRLSPRWAQLLVFAVLVFAGVSLVLLGVVERAGGPILAGLLVLAFAYALDAILQDIRRANAAAQPPSREAPGAPSGAGDAGKRARGGAALSDSGGSAAGERDAPMLRDGVSSTAGCARRGAALGVSGGSAAGRPRSFSEGRR